MMSPSFAADEGSISVTGSPVVPVLAILTAAEVQDSMDRLQLLREAIRELGPSSDEELAAFISQRSGVRVEARFIPIWRASLRGLEALEKSREGAKASKADHTNAVEGVVADV